MYSFEYCSDISIVLLPLDVAFTIFFIIEMTVKIKYLGKSFFKDKECVFDLLIVVVSSIPLFGLFSLDWIQVMRLTLVGLSILIFLLSIILSSLYGSIVPEYFGNPLESIYSVFRLFSIEGWYDIAEHSSYIMGFVSSMFIDEVTSDNNDEVLQRLSKLEEILKKIQENGTT